MKVVIPMSGLSSRFTSAGYTTPKHLIEIDGKKVYAKAILKDPEQYFTPEVMEKLDEIAKEEISYGS